MALLSLPKIGEFYLESLRCLITGGPPISLQLKRQIQELFPNALVGESYGRSETLPQGGVQTPLYRHKPGFIGTFQLNKAMIVDLETGVKEVPPNEKGELIIKGQAVMKGYWNNPEETKTALRDGWLYTGDIALMDEEGYVKLLGRKKEIIKSSGFTVFPHEVEDDLYCHPAVKEAVVVGISDSYQAEMLKAFIILKQEYVGKVTEKEIIDWCKDNMAAYKRPHVIEFRNELPKSAAGKVLRRILVDEEMKKSQKA